MKFRYLKIIGVILFFFSCQREPVVAVVNEQPIYLKEVILKLKELRAGTIAPGVMKGLFYETIEELIDREVVLTSFPDIAKSISSEELEREIFKNYSRDTAKKFLEEQGISYDEWFYTHRRDALAFLILERLFEKEGKGEPVQDVKRQEDEELSPYIEFLQIVTNTKEDIEKAQELIKKGAPFEEVVKEFSISPEGKNGGRLGPFFPGELPPEFDVCWTLKEGEVSDIIKSPYGYHLFKVLKKGKMKRTERIKNGVKEIEKMERKGEFFKNLIAELRKKAMIKRKRVPFESIKW
jgi:parvulin-like peptidyl-prolyl isomerase